MSKKPEILGRIKQIELNAVPAPTFAEITRGMAMRAGQRIANAILRAATVSDGKLRAVLAPAPHQVDWLNPTDFAIEQLAEHAGQFPTRLSGTFFCEIADRVEQMLKACATKQKDRRKTRRIGVAWHRVYYKLITAQNKYGDPELTAVTRGSGRPECVSLTSEGGVDLDPTALRADAVGGDPLAVLLESESDDDTDNVADGWRMKHDPGWANSARTAERWRAEERSLREMVARSAARCRELAGAIPYVVGGLS